MAAADVSALIEVASTPDSSPSPSPAPTESAVEETPVESTESSAKGSETRESQTETPTEGTDKVDARTNPDAIRKALKSWRDSSPENAPVARQLNDIVGRESAYRQVFPKVADAKQAKFILDSVGGGDGLTELQNTIKSVNETDSLLHAGDPRVVKNLYEDMKAVGKADSFGKLASPFLEQLQEVDPKAYKAAVRPHGLEYVVQSGFPNVVEGLESALATVVDGKPTPDIKLIESIAASMRKWLTTEQQAVEGGKKAAIDPDRQAFEKEKSEFQSAQQKAFQNEVHGDWNRINDKILGAALRPYLKMNFAKGWKEGTLRSVAGEIMGTALRELTADKAYQSQMDAYWSESKPDKSKIIKYHEDKMKLIGERIVQDVIETRYPGYRSMGGPAPAKKPAAAVTPATQSGPAKPIFQSTKPKMDDPNVDWDRDPDRMLYISGRFYDKKGAYRTWNPRYK
jgi:hypothetical protein